MDPWFIISVLDVDSFVKAGCTKPQVHVRWNENITRLTTATKVKTEALHGALHSNTTARTKDGGIFFLQPIQLPLVNTLITSFWKETCSSDLPRFARIHRVHDHSLSMSGSTWLVIIDKIPATLTKTIHYMGCLVASIYFYFFKIKIRFVFEKNLTTLWIVSQIKPKRSNCARFQG